MSVASPSSNLATSNLPRMSFFGTERTGPPRTTGLVPVGPTLEDSSIVPSPEGLLFARPPGRLGGQFSLLLPSRPAERSACQTATECTQLILAELTIGIGCSRRAPTSIPCSVSALLIQSPDWCRLTSCCPKIDNSTDDNTLLASDPSPSQRLAYPFGSVSLTAAPIPNRPSNASHGAGSNGTSRTGRAETKAFLAAVWSRLRTKLHWTASVHGVLCPIQYCVRRRVIRSAIYRDQEHRVYLCSRLLHWQVPTKLQSSLLRTKAFPLKVTKPCHDLQAEPWVISLVLRRG